MTQFKVHNMIFIYYSKYLPQKLPLINIQGYFTLGMGPCMGHSIQYLQLLLAKNMATR